MQPARRRSGPAWVALLLVSAACGSDGEAPQAPDPAFASVEELASLREALAEEQRRRGALETELAWLRAQVDALHAGAGAAADVIEEAGEEEALDPATEARRPQPPPGHPRGKLWFDDEALLAAGVPAWEAERLREAFDASEMAILDLHHQAQREGWAGTGRYRHEVAALRDQQRSELGEDGYDRMLYATGRRNRVEVRDLLRGSPGEQSGMQPGDVVLGYAGRRIFDPRELKEATLQGRVGESVAVDVLRDGQTIRLYVPRGPIGAKLKATRQMPAPR